MGKRRRDTGAGARPATSRGRRLGAVTGGRRFPADRRGYDPSFPPGICRPPGSAETRGSASWLILQPESVSGAVFVLSPLVQSPGFKIQSFLETTFRRNHSPSEEGADEDEDEDEFETLDDSDAFNEKVRGAQPLFLFNVAHTHTHTGLSLCLQFQKVPSDPAEAERLELMKMRTLERRAKTNELQRLRKAQVSESGCIHLLESSSSECSYTRGLEFTLLKLRKKTTCWEADEFIVECCLIKYLIWEDGETPCGD